MAAQFNILPCLCFHIFLRRYLHFKSRACGRALKSDSLHRRRKAFANGLRWRVRPLRLRVAPDIPTSARSWIRFLPSMYKAIPNPRATVHARMRSGTARANSTGFMGPQIINCGWQFPSLNEALAGSSNQKGARDEDGGWKSRMLLR
jgi:hypothetical protein